MAKSTTFQNPSDSLVPRTFWESHVDPNSYFYCRGRNISVTFPHKNYKFCPGVPIETGEMVLICNGNAASSPHGMSHTFSTPISTVF
jgi:hypothetical protein